MPCSTSPRVCFILTKPELYAIKLSKKYFADLCSKLTLVDVFGNMSRVLNCFQLKYCFSFHNAFLSLLIFLFQLHFKI